MDDLALDAIMYLVLIMGWIFGGAAAIDDGRNNGYREALKAWCLLSIFLAAAILFVAAAAWAVNRLLSL